MLRPDVVACTPGATLCQHRSAARSGKEHAMLSREENELVTRVGQGTPMGNAMRMYWIPALLSREIAEPDGPPARVRLLGEDLVAFRDSDGRIGLIEEFCPHRRVSLYFGRNEECGLRCIYHGWKFDVAGTCVDMMNEPEEYDFKHKVRITAYPTCELGGIVWAYHRARREASAAAEIRLDAGAGGQPPRHQGDRGVQLAAGAGRRHRHLARADPAPAADRQLASAAASSRPTRSCAARRRSWSSTSPTTATSTPASVRSTAATSAHPHLPLRHAVPPDPAVAVGERTGTRCRPHLGADR